MHKPKAEKTPHHELELKAIREALERASRAAKNAESVALQARGDLQNERRKYQHSSEELRRVGAELKETIEENKRLRQAVREFYQERETLTERIRQLTAATAPARLRVVEEHAVEGAEDAELEEAASEATADLATLGEEK